MHVDAGELAGILRVFRVPVVAVGNHQLVKGLCMRFASLIVILYSPLTFIRARDPGHDMFEADAFVHMEMPGIRLKVYLQLTMTRVIWIMVGHGKVFIFRPGL